ncbi:nucleolus and neural progenitor protein isoform X2 [Stigmatopora nigra]
MDLNTEVFPFAAFHIMEAEPWNKINVPLPSATSTVFVKFTPKTDRIITRLLMDTSETLTIIQSKLLQTEIRLLYALMYNLSNSKRAHKTYRVLKQVERCINRLREMKLDIALLDLSALCPKIIRRKLSLDEASCELPSQPILEWQCLKVLGAAQLLSCMLKHCRRAFLLTKQQMRHDFEVLNLTLSSMLSRIWVFFRGILSCLLSLYQRLYELRAEVALARPMPFLHFKLPAKMADFLDLCEVDSITSGTKSLGDGVGRRVEATNTKKIIEDFGVAVRRKPVLANKPVTVAKVKPVTVTKVKPVTVTKVKSVTVTKVKPVKVTKVKPVKVTKVKSGTVTKVKSGTVTKEKPVKVTKEKPVKVTKVKSDTVTKVKSDTVTKVKSGTVTKVKPVKVTKVKPVKVTKVKPVKVTKVKPVKVTKVKPDKVTKVKPDKVTKVKPDKVTKVKSVTDTKVKSVTVTKVKPVKVTKVKPDKVTKVKPVTVTKTVAKILPKKEDNGKRQRSFHRHIRQAATFKDMAFTLEEMIKWCTSKKRNQTKQHLTFLKLKCQRLTGAEALGYNVQNKLRKFKQDACQAQCGSQTPLLKSRYSFFACRKSDCRRKNLSSFKMHFIPSKVKNNVKKRVEPKKRLSSATLNDDWIGKIRVMSTPSSVANESYDDIDKIFASVGE